MEDKDSEIVHSLIDKVGDVIDGGNMGHVIPALIYILATAQDDDIMSEEQFVKSVAEDLFNWFKTFKAGTQEGNVEWLQ
jgi:hypothetical protein